MIDIGVRQIECGDDIESLGEEPREMTVASTGVKRAPSVARDELQQIIGSLAL
jgi:hypothetical protein